MDIFEQRILGERILNHLHWWASRRERHSNVRDDPIGSGNFMKFLQVHDADNIRVILGRSSSSHSTYNSLATSLTDNSEFIKTYHSYCHKFFRLFWFLIQLRLFLQLPLHFDILGVIRLFAYLLGISFLVIVTEAFITVVEHDFYQKLSHIQSKVGFDISR